MHGVPANDVPDLVTDCTRELVEVLGAVDEAAIHIDEAAGQREGVDLFAVDHEESPVEIGALGRLRDGQSELLDIVSDRRIANDRQPGIDLLRVLLADGDFLILTHGAGREEHDEARSQETELHAVASIAALCHCETLELVDCIAITVGAPPP